MIGIIGAKRVFIIMVLAVLNIILAAAFLLYLQPAKISQDRDLRTLRADISRLDQDITQIQQEFDTLDQQQAAYDALSESGFFSTQIRSDAKAIFSDIQKDSGVFSATVSVRPGVLEKNDLAIKANHNVLMSNVEIKISAFEDLDIYHYIELLETRFPGHISIEEVTLDRLRDVNATVLRSIASRNAPALIGGTIRAAWRTMIPEEDVIESSREARGRR